MKQIDPLSYPVKNVVNMMRPVNGVLVRFKAILRGVRTRLMAYASRSGFLASIYFAFFSARFYREHQAVLAAQVAYMKADLRSCTSSGALRRNIHRLEKALVMRPRRDSFADAYIGETVAQFAASYRGSIDTSEQKWAGDVLTLYFSVVRDTPVIARARQEFEKVNYCSTAPATQFIPYPKDAIPPASVSFEDLRRLFVERRSVRWFEDRAVPPELVEKAIEAASWAPTACNRQPYSFHLITAPEQAARISTLAGGTAGFSHNIPCLIVVVGDLSNYIEERDRHLIYIDASLASMQLLLALQTLGLSSVPINWPDVEEREAAMQAEMGLQVYERPVMLIAVGYGDPKGLIPYSQKKSLSVLVRRANESNSHEDN